MEEAGEVLFPDRTEVSGEAVLKADISKQIDALAIPILYMFLIEFVRRTLESYFIQTSVEDFCATLAKTSKGFFGLVCPFV